MASVIGIDKVFYSASAIVQVFNNAIAVPESKRLIQVKGIYLHGRGVNYNGLYYDQLKDEASDACLTLIVPALIRNTLTQNKTIEFTGFVTKKVVANGGRIELQLTVCDLLNQTINKFSEEEIRAIEIQQRKANQGFRDVDAALKKKLIAGEAINVVVLIGKNAIIDSDIKHQLEESIAAFSISFERINLSSIVEIFSTINRFDRDGVDVLVISRGGGEGIKVFNSCEIAERSLTLKPLFVTALGHFEDTPLLEKVADKKFITPSALGSYLNELYNQTVAELQDSKAKLVDDITKHLKAQYDKQSGNLNEQIQNIQVVNTANVKNLKDQLQSAFSMHQQQLQEKDRLLKNAEGLTENFKSEVSRLREELNRKAAEPPPQNYSWLIVLAAVVLLIVALKTCQ